MPRSPKRTDTHLAVFRIESANHEYLLARAKRLGGPWVEALNQEFEFLRTGDIPTPLSRRIQAFVTSKGSNLRDEIKILMWNASMKLPIGGSCHVLTSKRETHQTSANIFGPNYAYVLNRAMVTGRELSATINAELHFARSFELPAELLGRVEKYCVDQDITVRDWAQVELIRAAWQLPEAAAPPTSRRARSPY